MSLTEEQIEMHFHRVTASQVSIIMGDNPWETAHDLMCSKVEKRRIPSTDAMERGQLLEPVIKDWVMRNVLSDDTLFASHADDLRLFPQDKGMLEDTILYEGWAGATPDYLVVKKRKHGGGIVSAIECKSSASDMGYGYGGVPRHVWWQCQFQMYVLDKAAGIDLDCMYVGALLKSDFIYRIVHRDKEAMEDAVPILQHFQATVDKHRADETLPEAPESANVGEGVFDLDPDDLELDALFNDLVTAKDSKREADKILKSCQGVVLDKLMNHSHALYGGRRISVCKSNKKSTKLDYVKLARDLARILIREGKRKDVEALHQKHTHTFSKRPYLMVRKNATKNTG